MPFGLLPIHLLVIAVVALLIFGPSRLPEIGRGLGKAITEFRHGYKDMSDSIMEEINKPEQAKVDPEPKPVNNPEAVASGTSPCPQCGALNPVQARF